MCINVRAFVCMCACAYCSKVQQDVQTTAIDERNERARSRVRDALCPPIFALVPRHWPDGRLKVFLSVRVYVQMYTFVCMRVYAFVCLCMYVCVRLHVSKYACSCVHAD